MADPSPRASHCVTFRYSFPCDLGQVRAARVAARSFLEQQQLNEEEITACELALAEACNNAVQYATELGRHQPVEILLICTGSKIELHVHDHTAGFEMPEHVDLPSAEDEGGRGLFFIQSFMDGANYFRGHGENSLVMRKMRFHRAHRQRSIENTQVERASAQIPQTTEALQNMARELCCRSKTLGAIFRCSAELGRTNDLRLFTSRLLTELMSIASADFFFLRLFSESERHLNVFATSENSATLPPLNPGEGALSVEMEAAFTKKCIEFGPGRPLESGDALLAPLGSEASGLARPLVADDTLLGVLTVGRRLEAPPFSPEQAEAIHLFADFLGIQIVNARLREQHVTSRLLSHELELAAQIQRSLLPRTLPHPRGYGLAAHCESARQLGGDFCDVLQISENLLLLLVADVMGKGVPAALFASILHNLIRVMPEWLDRPADMLARVNSMLYERLSAVDMFITVQLALVDLKEKKITVATAGQGPVLLASKGLRTCEILCPEGMPLGVVGDPEFCNQTSTLGPNARVLLYTDGLTEARNAQGELFGLARLQAWLQASTRLSCSAEELKEFLLETLTHFGVESPLRDDQTFIILAEEMETS